MINKFRLDDGNVLQHPLLGAHCRCRERNETFWCFDLSETTARRSIIEVNDFIVPCLDRCAAQLCVESTNLSWTEINIKLNLYSRPPFSALDLYRRSLDQQVLVHLTRKENKVDIDILLRVDSITSISIPSIVMFLQS
jgi:hypothetical protein